MTKGLNLELSTSDEYGVHFETGVPVTFKFLRNTERAPNFGAKFGQDIEPAGRYLLHNPDPGRLAAAWQAGTISFQSPLVIPLTGDRDSIYGPAGWKARLRDATGLTGAALSKRLTELGFDGIVTVDPDGYTREIVSLPPTKNPRSEKELARLGYRRHSKEDHDTVEREYEQWLKESEEQQQSVIDAFKASPAIRGSGKQPKMAIKSGELSDTKYGKYRVTFFGTDGPHGHMTKDTDDDIAREARSVLELPVYPMTDAEVMAWTSTEEFEKGSKVTAFVQAENTLRWLAQKAGRGDWATTTILRANDVGTREGAVNSRNKPYDPAALDEALAIMYAALRELPQQNPRTKTLVRNPPWVTEALASSYEILDDKVPPQWLPQLASVKAGPKNSLTASLLEYGCGAYGCVLATLDPGTVLKVTSDESEATFAAQMSPTLVAPICVEYRLVVRLSGSHDGRAIHLLWRESAEHVGKIRSAIGGGQGKIAENLILDQHAAAQAAFHAHYTKAGTATVLELVEEWLETCQAMARGRVPELRPLGKGLLEVWERQRILFGDIHAGNLGLVKRSAGEAWVITDPGHVAVIWDN